MNEAANVQNTATSKGASDRTKINWQCALRGWLVVLSFLAAVAFWGTFAYAVWVRDMKLVMIFVKVIAIGAGVFGSIHFLSTLFRQTSRSL